MNERASATLQTSEGNGGRSLPGRPVHALKQSLFSLSPIEYKTGMSYFQVCSLELNTMAREMKINDENDLFYLESNLL